MNRNEKMIELYGYAQERSGPVQCRTCSHFDHGKCDLCGKVNAWWAACGKYEGGDNNAAD